MDLVDLIPVGWRTGDKAFISSYRMLGVSLQELSPPFTTVIGDFCLIMGWLGMPNLRVRSEFSFTPDGEIRVNIRGGGGEERDPAPIALFLLNAREVNQDALTIAQERIHEIVGLLSAVESLTIVFEHVEDYWLSFSGQRLEPVPTLIYDPLWIWRANLDVAARQRWASVMNLISDSPHSERIKLSLRWLDEGKRARGIDSFLKIWFALETLAMPNDTDIHPIREALGSVYQIPAREIDERFRVGRLVGLRSKIVHDGVRPEIKGELLALVTGIYLDVLAVMVGAESANRAQAALDDAGGILNILPSIVAPRSLQFTVEFTPKTMTASGW